MIIASSRIRRLSTLAAALVLLAVSTGEAFAGFTATVRSDRKAGVTDEEWDIYVSIESSLVALFTVQPNSKSFPTNAIVWNWTDSDCAGITLEQVREDLNLAVEVHNAQEGFYGVFSLDWQGGDCEGGGAVAIPSNFGATVVGGNAFRFSWGYPESSGFTFDLYKQDVTETEFIFDFSQATLYQTGLTGPPFEDSVIVPGNFYAYWLVAVRTADGARSTETSPFLVTLSEGEDAEITLLPAAAGTLSIQFEGILQSSPDMRNWQNIVPQPDSPFLVTPAPGAGFFRAVSP
jgi:hypothetical protein